MKTFYHEMIWKVIKIKLLFIAFFLVCCTTKPDDRFKHVDWDEVKSSYITLTTTKQDITLHLGGNTPIKILWGEERITKDILDTLLRDWYADDWWLPEFGPFSIEYNHTFRNVESNVIVIYGNITSLNANNNCISKIETENMESLKSLYISDNLLTTIDVRKNINIRELYLFMNKISHIVLCENPLLRSLDLSQNKLTSLSLCLNQSMQTIRIDNNEFTDYEINKLFLSLHDLRPYYFFEKSIFIANNPGTYTSNANIALDKGWRVVDSGEGFISFRFNTEEE